MTEPSPGALPRFVVYGLFDPRTNELRYIGKTINPERRREGHLKPCYLNRSPRNHRAQWIKSLLAEGLEPIFRVLLACASADDLYAAEQRMIKQAKEAGTRLTNATDGGPGRHGYILSTEERKKISLKVSAYQKKHPTDHTPETRAELRRLQLGRKHTDKTRSNMSSAHGGRPFVEVGSGMIFLSQTEAVEFFGWRRTTQVKVGMVLNGKKPQYKGKVFKYVAP